MVRAALFIGNQRIIWLESIPPPPTLLDPQSCVPHTSAPHPLLPVFGVKLVFLALTTDPFRCSSRISTFTEPLILLNSVKISFIVLNNDQSPKSS